MALVSTCELASCSQAFLRVDWEGVALWGYAWACSLTHVYHYTFVHAAATCDGGACSHIYDQSVATMATLLLQTGHTPAKLCVHIMVQKAHARLTRAAINFTRKLSRHFKICKNFSYTTPSVTLVSMWLFVYIIQAMWKLQHNRKQLINHVQAMQCLGIKYLLHISMCMCECML